jgi:hypothetical protein
MYNIENRIRVGLFKEHFHYLGVRSTGLEEDNAKRRFTKMYAKFVTYLEQPTQV